MQILVENSTWNNIGDAFYQTSLYFILRKVFPQHNVRMLEGPIYRSFRPNRLFKKNAFDLRLLQEGDIYCFSGPILDGKFLQVYGELIKSLLDRGHKYMLLSIHGHPTTFTMEIRNFLEKYPPLAFSSRDEPTFKTYSDICKQSYNGICTAFFVSITCPTADLIQNYRYVILSTYTIPDPKVVWDIDENGEIIYNSIQIVRRYMPWWRITRHFQWLYRSSASKHEYVIVRPVHDIGYKFSHLNFAKKNSFLSHNPFSYLSLYSGTALTISDRVHACVATLSYGKPAIFIGKTKRSTVFTRLGLDSENATIMQLSRDDLHEEYHRFCNWLRSVDIN